MCAYRTTLESHTLLLVQLKTPLESSEIFTFGHPLLTSPEYISNEMPRMRLLVPTTISSTHLRDHLAKLRLRDVRQTGMDDIDDLCKRRGTRTKDVENDGKVYENRQTFGP